MISPFIALPLAGELADIFSTALGAVLASYLGEMETRVKAVNDPNAE